MRAYRYHLGYELQAVLRNRLLLFMNYLLPLGFYLIMGLLMTRLNPLFTPNMVPAMVLFGVLSACLLALPGPIAAARETGIYRTFRINGVPAISVLTIPLLAAAIQTLVLAAIIAATAPMLFSAPLPANWLGFVAVILVSVYAVASLGVLIGVISTTATATVAWSQVLYVPSMILSGMMAPSEYLPQDLAGAALLLPATHVMRAFRDVGGMDATVTGGMVSLCVLLAGGTMALLLASHLFSWDQHDPSRRAPLWLALLALLPYGLSVLLMR